MPKFFMLKIEKSSVLLELTINGAPLVLPAEKGDIDNAEALNPWIKPGKNVLNIYLTWPDEVPYQPDLAHCKLHLEALEEGQGMGNSGSPLVDFVWPIPPKSSDIPTDPAEPEHPVPPPEQTEYYPYEIAIEFSVNQAEAPPSRLWQEAMPIPWKDKEEITHRLTILHKALDQKDIKTTTRLLDFKAVDAGSTQYMSPDEARQSQKEFFEFLFEIEDWGMEALEPGNLDFHLLADDRILLVSGSGMTPALRSKDSTKPQLLLPVYFALIENVWLIVR